MRKNLMVLLASSFVSTAFAQDCNDIYRIAISKAQVQTLDDLRVRTRQYLKSDDFKKSSDYKNLDSGGAYGVISGYLGLTSEQDSTSRSRLEKASAGDWEKVQTLYFVDRTYGLGLLKLYNDCLAGSGQVTAQFTYTPGTRNGAITVQTKASGIQTSIRSVHTSGLTLKGEGFIPFLRQVPIRKGVMVDSGGVNAEFDVDPKAKVAWILVQTAAGGAKAVLETGIEPTPTPSMPSTGPIRSKRVTVLAKAGGWSDSEIALSEGEVAKITVDPEHSEWIVRDKKPSSFRGLDCSAGGELIAPNLPVGALLILDGDGRIYGFNRGIDEIWVRIPGRIKFLCNETHTVWSWHGTHTSGFDDNSGEVVAVVDVFPVKKSLN